MAKDHELSGLIKWSRHEDWSELFDAVLYEHFGQAFEDYGIDFDTLEKLIGEKEMTNLWGCAFEDFVTQPRSPEDPSTIADDYLKRRGWKEGPSKRRYIEALRDSIFSLYAVSDVVAGQSMVLTDLIRDGSPVRITEHTATRALNEGDRLGCRIVTVAGVNRLAGGLTRFDEDVAEQAISQLRTAIEAMRDLAVELRGNQTDADSGGIDDASLLRDLAPEFTMIWLEGTLNGRLPKIPPPRFNSDGEELAAHTVSYPLTPGTSPDAVARILNSIRELCPEEDGVWNWIDRPDEEDHDKGPRPRSAVASAVREETLYVNLEDGTPVLATIELFADGLILVANSRQRADSGKIMLKSLLKGMLGQPETHADDPSGDPPQAPS
ncbi:MAG: hypothetical protein KF914_10835 [Rhizobiaceae bacterium]|nr:hypothetical protein [Rhizobiaceae bacterium]